MSVYPDPSLSRSAIGTAPPDTYRPRFDAYEHARYAGFWRRFVASFIDSILLAIVNAILVRLLLKTIFDAGASESDSLERQLAWFWIEQGFYVALGWLYFAGMESSARQATFGKQALGIIVTDLDRNRISFGRASGRFAASYLSAITLLIGFLIQPFTEKRQTLHDIIAGTLVIHNWPRVPADYRPGLR